MELIAMPRSQIKPAMAGLFHPVVSMMFVTKPSTKLNAVSIPASTTKSAKTVNHAA